MSNLRDFENTVEELIYTGRVEGKLLDPLSSNHISFLLSPPSFSSER